jgi:hypothetical protein
VIGRAALLALAILGLGGCRDRPRDDAASAQRDRARLEQIVAADARIDRALKEADDASHAGDDARAALVLEKTALPAADEAIAEATHDTVETPWGRARREELLALLADRRTEIPRYAAALRGTDLDAKLAAVEAQLALQKRALQTATAVMAGPSAADAIAK